MACELTPALMQHSLLLLECLPQEIDPGVVPHQRPHTHTSSHAGEHLRSRR